MASRSATSLGWTPQRVASVATPLSRCVRAIISGQKYEVSDIRKGGKRKPPLKGGGDMLRIGQRLVYGQNGEAFVVG